MVVITDVVEWVFEEYDQRIRAGKSGTETIREVKALVEEHGRVQELWKARGHFMLAQIYVDGLRNRTAQTVQPARNRNTSYAATPHTVSPHPAVSHSFGEPRVDLAELAKPESIFDALVHVGSKYMRYGDMHREHWEIKRDEYGLLADNSFRRKSACNRILERMVGDLTTEECISEEDFRRLAAVFA